MQPYSKSKCYDSMFEYTTASMCAECSYWYSVSKFSRVLTMKQLHVLYMEWCTGGEPKQ